MKAALPEVVAVPGAPVLLIDRYDLQVLGYVVEEYFLSGTARAFQPSAPQDVDGAWVVHTGDSAPFVTRIVVVRPAEPKQSNNMVVVEWLNVSGGRDGAAEWMFVHREILRGGYTYIGVSAQQVGIEGGFSLNPAALPLKKADPTRYAKLGHPGDRYSFDIFTRVGAAVRAGLIAGVGRPEYLLAVGESQSARFLVTYVNAIDRLESLYDGFFIHSRSGGGASLDGISAYAQEPVQGPAWTRFRKDMRVPVLTLITETDLLGLPPGRPGYHAARQPDNDLLRVWEVAGSAHADNYTFLIAPLDSGEMPADELAALWAPTANIVGIPLARPMNCGPQHHYVACAALRHLKAWIVHGKPPPHAPRPLDMRTGAADGVPDFERDEVGNAKGGIRTPWVDVPVARLTGEYNEGGPFGFLVGTAEPFDRATLDRLYPGGRSEYLDRFAVALDDAVAAGFILPEDRGEILDVAASGAPFG